MEKKRCLFIFNDTHTQIVQISFAKGAKVWKRWKQKKKFLKRIITITTVSAVVIEREADRQEKSKKKKEYRLSIQTNLNKRQIIWCYENVCSKHEVDTVGTVSKKIVLIYYDFCTVPM